MSESKLDLSRLALDRTETSVAAPRSKRWFSRYVVPVAILLGFAALLGLAAGQQFASKTAVTIIPVIVKRSSTQPAGTVAFQAPGWIEPRPTAITVASLAPGVIEELLVVEGQTVEANEAIARLISIDAELDVEQAKNELAIYEGGLNRATAERDAAQIRFDNPVHLQVQVADARSALAKIQTEIAKLPFLIEASEAAVKYSRSSMERRRSAGDAIAGRIVQQSENEHAAANATLRELQQRGPNLRREADALQEKHSVLEKQLRLLIEETRQLKEAQAKLQSAMAVRDDAKLRVRQAELKLDRNTVRSPVAGRILRLVAAPGTRVMGLDTSAGHSSSTIAEMYDPARLQVRADVRLEDVPMVTRGQRVEIETASSAGVIKGRVLQATSSANVQKNTLEVKIELLNPPVAVSPEMLVTARFLNAATAAAGPVPNAGSATSRTETERIFVPMTLVDESDAGKIVWIVDAESRAQIRTVEIATVDSDGLVEIRSGLGVTDKLVVDGRDDLVSGCAVVITGDDQTLGIGN